MENSKGCILNYSRIKGAIEENRKTPIYKKKPGISFARSQRYLFKELLDEK